MDNKIYNADPAGSGMAIRKTDNSPKNGDIFDEDYQSTSPLTEDEILSILEQEINLAEDGLDGWTERGC